MVEDELFDIVDIGSSKARLSFVDDLCKTTLVATDAEDRFFDPESFEELGGHDATIVAVGENKYYRTTVEKLRNEVVGYIAIDKYGSRDVVVFGELVDLIVYIVVGVPNKAN
jgi:hypothetical protein